MFRLAARPVARCPLLVGWLVVLAGCSSQIVSLGQREPKDAGVVVDAPSIDASIEPPSDAAAVDATAADASPTDATADAWAPPTVTNITLVTELASPATSDNPTLTDNRLLIFFSSLRGDGGTNSDIWFVSRSSVNLPFGAPQAIPALSTDLIEGSPAVSGDGLTLWLSIKTTDTGATSDIWRSTRSSLTSAWPSPTVVAELNSTADDIPRPPGNGNLTMPLGSRRDGDHFLTYLATRPSTGAPFAAPLHASELDVTGYNTADAFLTQDGLTIFFTRAQNESGDIYVAHRATKDVPFEPPQPLSGINTAADERDPWVSPDGKILYFVSDRGGVLNIYQASLVQP